MTYFLIDHFIKETTWLHSNSKIVSRCAKLENVLFGHRCLLVSTQVSTVQPGYCNVKSVLESALPYSAVKVDVMFY